MSGARMSLARRAKDGVKSLVAGRFPGLIKLAASEEAKGRLSVRTSALCVDVIDERARKLIRLNRANSVYVLDMLNCFDYYFSSVEPVRVRRGTGSYAMVDFSSPRYQAIAGF